MNHWSVIKLRDFVDLYEQTHRNIQQNQGGLDQPCNVTSQIDISFVYFRFFLLFCAVIAEDLGILCWHFQHMVQQSQFRFIQLNADNISVTFTFVIVYFDQQAFLLILSVFLFQIIYLKFSTFYLLHICAVKFVIVFTWLAMMLGKGR